MVTMNVSLPKPMKSWVEQQTNDGRFSNASDYVRDLIRRDQERHSAFDLLQSAIIQGAESGDAQPFDATQFKLDMRERHIVK